MSPLRNHATTSHATTLMAHGPRPMPYVLRSFPHGSRPDKIEKLLTLRFHYIGPYRFNDEADQRFGV
ncbi:MAG: hypothetical protein AMXMBFR16_06940 [Candidatus Uhrbacteria bacterium]